MLGALRSIPLAVALLAAVAQHVEPPVFPEGHFCQHHVSKGDATAHPCDCQRECVPNIELGEDGKPHETVTVKEDPQCKQFCHADHCHCPAKNCQ
jgi:hypothetical protein